MNMEYVSTKWCKPLVDGVVVGALTTGVVIKCDACKQMHSLATVDPTENKEYTKTMMTQIEKDIEDLNRMVQNMWDAIKQGKTTEERNRCIDALAILTNALARMKKL